MIRQNKTASRTSILTVALVLTCGVLALPCNARTIVNPDASSGQRGSLRMKNNTQMARDDFFGKINEAARRAMTENSALKNHSIKMYVDVDQDSRTIGATISFSGMKNDKSTYEINLDSRGNVISEGPIARVAEPSPKSAFAQDSSNLLN